MNRANLLVVALAAFLAAIGAVPTADHTTHRVFEMVRPIPWSETLLPFWNPPPMEAWAIRPISVVLVKALLELPGLHAIPSIPLLFFGAFASLCLFGLSSLVWLRRTGLAAVALPATISCMLLGPTLFSAWLLTELDTFGAGLILAGSALLLRRGKLGWRVVPATACVLLGLLIKESTGLISFAFLGAGAVLFEWHHRRRRARRHWGLLGLGVLIWTGLVILTLSGKESLVGRSTWMDRLPILEHNQAQFVYLATIPGAVIIGLGAFWSILGPTKLRNALPWMGAVLLFLLPPLVYYSHYEAVYYSPRWVPSAVGVLLWVGIGIGITRRVEREEERLPHWVLVLTFLGFGAAVIAASNPREDMASRLFLAIAPALHGIAWASLHRMWTTGPAVGWQRGGVAILVASMAWTPLASCWNQTIAWRSLQAVDLPARRVLVTQDLRDSKLVFNHFSTWLGTQEMAALGWTENSVHPTRLVKTPAWLRRDELPPMDWGTGLDDLEHDYETGIPIWVYWLAARSEMPEEVNRQLVGDLAWTRRPLGLFTPINHAPGNTPEAQARRANLPAVNLAEDMRRTTWTEETPTLLQLSRERGESIHREATRYRLLPTLLPDLGQRIFRGIPWLESYRIEAELFVLHYESGNETDELVPIGIDLGEESSDIQAPD